MGLSFACSLAFGAPAKTATGKVTAVRFWSLGDVTRVAIEVSSEFHYKSQRLTNPDRLFFDIQGAKPEMAEKGMHVIPVGDPLVIQIRVAETQPGVTRVVLDLAQSAEFTASQLSGPDRLMVEVRLKDGPAPPATGSTSGAKLLTDSPVRAAGPDLIASASAAPASAANTNAATPLAAPDPARGGAAPPPANAAKPETVLTKVPKPFDPPPQRADPPHPESKPVLIGQPGFIPTTRVPKNPLPPPSVKPDATVVANMSASASTNVPIPNPSAPAPANSPVLPPYVPAFASANVPPASVPSPPSESTRDPGPSRESLPGREPLPAKSTANGNRSLTRVLGLKLGRVVIDPGHGGHDVGTHGPSGLNEKEVVLDVAKRLGALLEDRLATEVIYTRDRDTYIPLEERTRIANDHKADLFLSIHANSSPYRTAAGVETYYLNFTTSKAALDVAARENAGSERSVFDLKEILQKIALKDKIDESREFASSLQKSLYGVSAKGNVDAKNRGIKKAPFVVLIGAQMPSVLAEIGFLTNASDEALLRKPEHRQKIAEALYKGIANYAESLSHFQVAKRE